MTVAKSFLPNFNLSFVNTIERALRMEKSSVSLTSGLHAIEEWWNEKKLGIAISTQGCGPCAH
jgi:hypothetical protein